MSQNTYLEIQLILPINSELCMTIYFYNFTLYIQSYYCLIPCNKRKENSNIHRKTITYIVTRTIIRHCFLRQKSKLLDVVVGCRKCYWGHQSGRRLWFLGLDGNTCWQKTEWQPATKLHCSANLHFQGTMFWMKMLSLTFHISLNLMHIMLKNKYIQIKGI